MSLDPPVSRPASPFTRPPSRSERLLRDTLLRDELERRQPPPSPSPRRRRRPASPCRCSLDNDRNDDKDIDNEWSLLRNSPLFRSTATHSPSLVRNKSTSHVVHPHRNSSPPPSPIRYHAHNPSSLSLQRSPNSFAEGMAMNIPTSSTKAERRHSSRSISSITSSPPLYRSSSPTPGAGLTPHEQVLKARLERVLNEASAASEERKRSGSDVRERKRISLDEVVLGRKRRSGGSKNSIDGDGWKWGPLHDSPVSSEGSSETSTRPSPQTPPQTLHHHPHTPPRTHTPLPLAHPFPTPPPTPPSLSLSSLSTSEYHHHHSHPQSLSQSPQRPSFNARKASERCRQMEGYVSFASVEGLGEPPAGVDDDEYECDEGNTGRIGGSLTHGLKNLKIWRSWPFVGEATAPHKRTTN